MPTLPRTPPPKSDKQSSNQNIVTQSADSSSDKPQSESAAGTSTDQHPQGESAIQTEELNNVQIDSAQSSSGTQPPVSDDLNKTEDQSSDVHKDDEQSHIKENDEQSNTEKVNEQSDLSIDDKQSDQQSSEHKSNQSDQQITTSNQLNDPLIRPTEAQTSEQVTSNGNNMTSTEYGDQKLQELKAHHKLLANTVIRVENRLDSNNYATWTIEFPAKMRGVHLWTIISKKWTATTMESDDWQELNDKARDNILLNVAPTFQNYVRHEKTAAGMYTRLQEYFEGNIINRGWRLCKDLAKLLQSQTQELDKIAFEYQNLVDKFNEIFPAIPEEFHISLFCAVIPERFDYILSDVLSRDQMSYKEIIKMTMSAHTRARENGNDGPTISNCNSMPNGQHTGTKQFGQRAHNSNGAKATNNNKPFNTPKQKQNKPRFDRFKAYHCEYCNKPGHSTSRCTQLSSALIDGTLTPEQARRYTQKSDASTSEENPSNASGNNSQSNNNVKPKVHNINVILANVNESRSELDPNAWYMDDGAASMVTNSPAGAIQLFQHDAQIRDWENRISTIDGVGTYKLQSENGHQFVIDNVLYKRTAAASFFAYNKIDRMNKFKRVHDNGVQEIYHKESGDLVMLATIEPHGLYRLNIRAVTDVTINVVRISEKIPIEFKYRYWHNKLGHGSFGYIKKIKGALGLNEELKTKLTCDPCVEAKATKYPFPRSLSLSQEMFELVHTDLSGIIRIPNPEGFSYFLIFVEDLTRYITVFLLSRKFQVAKCYQQYRNWVKVQFNKEIKCLRSDNGGEFCNKEMDELTVNQGTNRNYTVHHNPQQNARAERQNRSIENLARALLRNRRLHIRFWPYAVLFAVLLKNILPHAGVNFAIPYELLFGICPDYNSLLEFGIRVFVILAGYKKKFEDRAVPAIFLGYPQGVKGHFVYLINEDKIDISRDVYLSEEAAANAVHLTVPERELDEAKLAAKYEADRESESWYTRLLFEYDNESISDLLKEQQEFDDDLDEQIDALQPVYVDQEDPPVIADEPVHEQQADQQTEQNSEKEEPKLISEVIDLKNAPAETEQPKGEFIFNKTEKKLFQERFPESQFRYVSHRKIDKPGKFNLYQVNALIAGRALQPPRSYEQAASADYRQIFRPAMDAEMAAHMQSRSWTLVERPPNARVYPMIWLYNYKKDLNGKPVRGKARLVVLGNRQVIEIGENNYAPVINAVAARVMISLAVTDGDHLHHWDCDTAFLNADVEGEIYCYQPKGYVTVGHEHLVCRMNKAVYGMRQSARRWYLHLRSTLIKKGFDQLYTDSCIYVKKFEKSPLAMGVFVDDLLTKCGDLDTLAGFRTEFASEIAIKDHGPIKKFLGLDFKRNEAAGTLEMSNVDYIENILREAEFDKCNGSKIPIREQDFKAARSLLNVDYCTLQEIQWYQHIVGQLMYVANLYRFDLAFVVGFLCSAMHHPTRAHLVVLKQLLRYLQYSKTMPLRFTKNDPSLTIYADSNFEEKNSKHGLMAFVNGNIVSWISRKQQRVATSTCEAEVLSVLDAVNEAEYLRSLLDELGRSEITSEPATIYNDNKSAQGTVMTGGDFSKNRHYRGSVHRVQFAMDDGLVRVMHMPSGEMPADVLTKPVGYLKLQKHCKSAGLYE